MDFLKFFMLALGFSFWMWRRPLACGILLLLSAEYSSNVQGLAGNLSEMTVALSQYDILLCSETLVSDMPPMSEIMVPRFGHPVCLCRGKIPRARGMAAYVRDGYGSFCWPKFEWLQNAGF